jgi:outer membrane protein assembly factor BamB
MRASEAATPAVATWTFEGDGSLTTAPIVVNGFVYVGSTSGRLYAVDPATGQSVWSTDTGLEIQGPDEQNVSQPLTGLAAGQGILAVPASGTLIAYGG